MSELRVNYLRTSISNLLPGIYSRITYAKEIGKSAGVKPELMQLYLEVEQTLRHMEDVISENQYDLTYVNTLTRGLDKLGSGFSTDYGVQTEDKSLPLSAEEVPIFKVQQERHEQEIIEAFDSFKQTLDFFRKVEFMNRDLVIIGSNGAGKSSLAERLKSHIKDNGIIISAQRILKVPNLGQLKIASAVAEELKAVQVAEKRNRGTDFNLLEQEYERILQALVSADTVANAAYAQAALEQQQAGVSIEPPKKTALKKTFEIWNSVFKSPRLAIWDGMNISAAVEDDSYHISKMSDGEKVVLFMIGHVLLCPLNGFVIVDEPEMHLHPTAHKMLWDRLEAERSDIRFMYLTHDLEFAASRTTAKKLWLRSFTHPLTFQLEEIPTSKIPKPLLMELLGSRHNIMFCEGTTGSYDTQLYAILFPDFIVKPVGGCLAVIGYTKAYNMIPDKAVRAVGLIDADYHSQERIESVAKENIYAIRLAEVENLLLMEEVLIGICHKFNKDATLVDKIKVNVLAHLKMNKDKQVVEFVTARVNQYLAETHVSTSATLIGLDSNYRDYLKKIDILAWSAERTQQIEKTIINNDYETAIRIMNDKGLRAIVEKVLKIKNYNDVAIEFLKGEELLRQGLLAAFPVNEIRQGD